MISIPSVANFITINVLHVYLVSHSFLVVLICSVLSGFIVTGYLLIMVHKQSIRKSEVG